VSAPEPVFRVLIVNRRAGGGEDWTFSLTATGPEIAEIRGTARCQGCGATPQPEPAPADHDFALAIEHEACGRWLDLVREFTSAAPGRTP